MPNIDGLMAYGHRLLDTVIVWATSPQFYAQVGAIVAAVALAHVTAKQIKARIGFFQKEPTEGSLLKIRQWIFACRDLLFSVFSVLALAIAIELTSAIVGTAWLVLIAQSGAVVFVLYTAINRFITHPLVRAACIWLGIPLATLKVFGLLDETIAVLDGISLEVGNIRLSVYLLAKAAIAGGIMFWLGRLSSNAGQKAIREQQALDISTRELFAKLFEIALFFVIFILLLQILGLDLTALTVFGGALGIGLGFGLQQIAANFISGMIVLLERSISVGDYIELADGKAGTLKELNMRSSTLRTFDGKEINVPNEKFITTQFINWTREDPHQRYEAEFSVSYDTDLHKVPPIIEAAVSRHPRVLKEPEEPDCELRGFGNWGVDFAVEFWVDGLDEGPNKFSSDVLFLIWDALTQNNITIPFPRHDVRIVEEGVRKLGLAQTNQTRE
ncbi:MAG: mechanosensitive ion channel [Hyphomicrobiales bacterium]|nr:mechanosensitive ion channel [Hyphomicrobiales bacterium]